MPPPDPGSFTPTFPPLAAFGGSPIYITGEDALRLTVMNAAAGVTVTITGRMLEFGQTRPTVFTQNFVPATDRSVVTVVMPIGDGWLLNVQVLVSAGTPQLCQCFARLSLVHGLTSVAAEVFTLCADYVTGKQPLSYPGSNVVDTLDGAGALRSITGATPGAGAEISETVPTGARWQLIALTARLATSATVANRFATLKITDATPLILFWADPPEAEIASDSWAYVACLGGQRLIAVNSTKQWGLPSTLYLPAGAIMKTVTAGIQAGDQWSVVQYLVREWIEGA